jgi:hypothetical protein
MSAQHVSCSTNTDQPDLIHALEHPQQFLAVEVEHRHESAEPVLAGFLETQ